MNGGRRPTRGKGRKPNKPRRTYTNTNTQYRASDECSISVYMLGRGRPAAQRLQLPRVVSVCIGCGHLAAQLLQLLRGSK